MHSHTKFSKPDPSIQACKNLQWKLPELHIVNSNQICLTTTWHLWFKFEPKEPLLLKFELQMDRKSLQYVLNSARNSKNIYIIEH